MEEGSNAPLEISSKKRVGVYKQVIPLKKKRRGDPRFDEKFGEIKPSFAKSYEFIDDIKKKELKLLSDKLKSKKLPEEARKEMGQAKTILHDQLTTKENKRKLDEIRREQRRKEAKLVAKGKMPYYAKKSEIKKVYKEQKYDELQRRGQLDKWMAKKSKRTASKLRKQMPRRRNREDE